MYSTYVVTFKGERKDTYYADKNELYRPGEFVFVQQEKGIHLGRISYLKAPSKDEAPEHVFRKIKRRANDVDIEQLNTIKEKEYNTYILCREKIKELELEMKLVDAEWQFDSGKVTVFFTAEQRVNFRELVKILAQTYKTRVELRQIGVRDEARRVGGYGKCGQKLCCTTFIEEFKPITTQMARDQLLTGNPDKLSGACGRLMCCLTYEYDMYKEELAHYPQIGDSIQSVSGSAVVTNINIFTSTVRIRYDDNMEESLTLEELAEMQEGTAEHGDHE